MIEGWVYYDWALETDVLLALGGVRRKGGGFIGAEIERLLKIAKDAINKDKPDS